MGSFGIGPFENDAALDWLTKFAESPEKNIRAALSVPKSKLSSSSTKACCAIAAAYLVSGKKLSSKERKLLSASGVADPDVAIEADNQLLAKAVEALEAIQSTDSELYQEWDDSGLAEDWSAALEKVLSAIRKRIGKEDPPVATIKKKVARKRKKTGKRLVGKPPILGEIVVREFVAMYYHILDRIEVNCTPKVQKHLVTPLVANIRILCCLLNEHPPRPRRAFFHEGDVEDWKTYVEANLETSIKSIPESCREEFLEAIKNDFEFLDGFFSWKNDNDRDMAFDLSY